MTSFGWLTVSKNYYKIGVNSTTVIITSPKIIFLDVSFWRMATAFPIMDIKGSTTTAKYACYMTLVYHNFVYMIMFRLVTTKTSMLSKTFTDKLAAAKTSAQLDQLVDDVNENHFPNIIKNGWNIPKLEDMEKEVIHLTTDWNDQRVSLIYLSNV